ncbi:hypothetical protein HMPREF3204_00810 [Gardnerella pickettii]|nr:hypothetical protein HMPREF3204_00810 [Gardnerella pickettii]
MARAMRVVGDLADGGELKSTSKEAHRLGEPLTTKTILRIHLHNILVATVKVLSIRPT